jgi:rod shape-determining protein MreC
MRNLFAYLWKNHAFLLFVFLEVISFYLIFTNNSYQRSSFVNSSNRFTSSILQVGNNITEYFYLKTQNELLAKENAKLRSQLTSAYITTSKKVFEKNDTLYRQQYTFTELKIINNTLQFRDNYIQLNKGSLQGIQPEMALIASNGIVGIVKDVSPNFCSAISVLHSNALIDAKIKKSGYTGTLKWNGGSHRICNLLNIPAHVKLSKGDTIVTSVNSNIFPEGILIGTIKNFHLNSGESFYNIEVQYSIDYNKLEYAYAVINLFKEEQKNLIQQSTND